MAFTIILVCFRESQKWEKTKKVLTKDSLGVKAPQLSFVSSPPRQQARQSKVKQSKARQSKAEHFVFQTTAKLSLEQKTGSTIYFFLTKGKTFFSPVTLQNFPWYNCFTVSDFLKNMVVFLKLLCPLTTVTDWQRPLGKFPKKYQVWWGKAYSGNHQNVVWPSLGFLWPGSKSRSKEQAAAAAKRPAAW